MCYWRYFLLSLSVLSLGRVFNTAEGTVEEVLRTISERACNSCSEALLVTHKGNFISVDGDHYMEPIETHSITKSFVSLAIGILWQEGKIHSVDTPVFYFFPEWRQGNKKFVTIRHLLNHTSGMETEESLAELYQFPDAVKMALACDLTSSPDTRFIYNNTAVNLLAAIVERASGMNIYEYLKTQLFDPLCINSTSWLCDNVGNHYGMSHLSINGVDLMKIGVLLANDGCWNGRRILSSEWIKFMKQPSQIFTPFYSSLWWLGYYSMSLYWDDSLIDQYDAAGVPCEHILALQSLQGRVLSFEGHICYGNFLQQCVPQLISHFGTIQAVYDFFAIIEKKGLPIGRWEIGELRSISARGYLGQQLIVFPAEKVVAIRLSNSTNTTERSDTLPDLESWIALLVYEMSGYAPLESQ